jgi:HD-like signal output (HDOD) protein
MAQGQEVTVKFDEEQIRAAIDDICDLPTIPKIGFKIVELASDPDVSIEQLTNAINQDPSLAARILKVANSPFYGAARHVNSMQLALVILGLNEVRNIAMGVTFFNAMKSLSPKVSKYRETFWHHSAACGMVARILGRKLDIQSESTDFIAGLLHDMGKIVIDASFGSKIGPHLDKASKDSPPVIEAELELLGVTHEKIGAWLAEKWSLPDEICDAIAYHHEFASMESLNGIRDPKTVSISYISEAFCDTYKLGWDGDSGSCDLRNRRVWDVLLSGQNTYTPDDIGPIITETLQVFKEARPHLLWE